MSDERLIEELLLQVGDLSVTYEARLAVYQVDGIYSGCKSVSFKVRRGTTMAWLEKAVGKALSARPSYACSDRGWIDQVRKQRSTQLMRRRLCRT